MQHKKFGVVDISTISAVTPLFSAIRCSHTGMYAALRFSKIKAFHLDIAKSQRPRVLGNATGFSLIELLVAGLLSAIVLSAFFKFYLIDIQISHDARLEVQREDELRFLNLSLRRAVQSAGYVGPCSGKPLLERDSTIDGFSHFLSPFMAFTKANLKNAAPPMRAAVSNPLSDILFIEYLSNDAKPLAIFPNNTQDNLSLPKIESLESGDLLMLADCKQATLFTVLGWDHGAAIHVNEARGLHPFKFIPAPPTLVGHAIQQAVYLGVTDEKNAQGQSQQAIFLKQLKANVNTENSRPAEALMIGVNDFKMLFSQKILDNVVWRSADAVSNWHHVTGVKFIITLPPLHEREKEKTIEYVFARRNGMSPEF